MRLLATTVLGLTSISLAAATGAKAPTPRPDDAFRVASICVRTGEKISGAVKTCFYNCGGEGRELTVNSRAVCPLTITY